MRYDAIIIGGGLSSLVCGIRLQRVGRKCLIVSSGQNSLHFSSGSLGLLSRLPVGTRVSEPLAALGSLGIEHPYSKIGTEKVIEYSDSVPEFFSSCGISLEGSNRRNGFILTPLGTRKSAWLAMKDFTMLESKDEKIGDKVLIVNFNGFLDFNASFIVEGLEKHGSQCRVETVSLQEVEHLRQNPSEMRSVNIARVMNKEKNWKEFAHTVGGLLKGEDTVVLPAVFGFDNPIVMDWLREMIPARLFFVGTMPPSVPGIRAQLRLKKEFVDAGGTFLKGDVALSPEFSLRSVVSIRTSNLGEYRLRADEFILASGNLFGRGIETSQQSVCEPVFGLDVDVPETRSEWYDKDFFRTQNFLGFGVRTDSSFHPYRRGEIIENLHVIGSELGGCNSLEEGSGAGVAILSAMKVAEDLLNQD